MVCKHHSHGMLLPWAGDRHSILKSKGADVPSPNLQKTKGRSMDQIFPYINFLFFTVSSYIFGTWACLTLLKYSERCCLQCNVKYWKLFPLEALPVSLGLQTTWSLPHLRMTVLCSITRDGQIWPTVCVYKVLLEHSHTHAFTYCLWQLSLYGRIE